MVVSIETDSGNFLTTEMKSVPRIGETVVIRSAKYKVQDVEYTIGDSYTYDSIKIKLVWFKNE